MWGYARDRGAAYSMGSHNVVTVEMESRVHFEEVILRIYEAAEGSRVGVMFLKVLYRT